MISDDEVMAVAGPLPPAERRAYLARICAGDPPRRVHLAAKLRAYDAAKKGAEPRGNMNDVPSTALLQTLAGQIRRFIFFLAAFAAGEAGGIVAGKQQLGALTLFLKVLPADTTSLALGLVLIVAFVVHMWLDSRRWLLAGVLLTAFCHGCLWKAA